MCKTVQRWGSQFIHSSPNEGDRTKEQVRVCDTHEEEHSSVGIIMTIYNSITCDADLTNDPLPAKAKLQVHLNAITTVHQTTDVTKWNTFLCNISYRVFLNKLSSNSISGQMNTHITYTKPINMQHTMHQRREENQLDATECFYCTYNLLNMFRALICPSSGARVYTCVIAAYGV